MSHQPTIVAHSTPPGQSGIAVIRLSGPDAIAIVSDLSGRADLVASAAGGSSSLSAGQAGVTRAGSWLRDNNELIDEVVITTFRAPRSYTGEDVVEISCHGSMYIVRRILELCIDRGATLAKPGEFTLRAFFNGKMDLSQAEAVADIIASESKAAHGLALNQMRGGVSNQVKELRKKLIDFASLLELELDFSEEDVEFANRGQLKMLVTEIRHVVHQLMESFRLGNAIKHGVVTVIAGRPNAGKSTLLNALLNEERAIVSPIPGTTRDTIEEVIHIDGIAFRLIDTAGIREAQDQIEAIGVERTMQKIEQAAILIYVFDVTEISAANLHQDLEKLGFGTGGAAGAIGTTGDMKSNLILVPNKMDLNPYAEKSEWTGNGIDEGMIVPMSAKNNMNTAYLKEKLVDAVKAGEHPADLPVISSARHYEALRQVEESLMMVERGLQEGYTTDLIATDLRHALHWLGEITGEVTNDELLGNIFGKFCIGK